MNEIILQELIDRWNEKAAVLSNEKGFVAGLGSGYRAAAKELEQLVHILSPIPEKELQGLLKDETQTQT